MAAVNRSKHCSSAIAVKLVKKALTANNSSSQIISFRWQLFVRFVVFLWWNILFTAQLVRKFFTTTKWKKWKKHWIYFVHPHPPLGLLQSNVLFSYIVTCYITTFSTTTIFTAQSQNNIWNFCRERVKNSMHMFLIKSSESDLNWEKYLWSVAQWKEPGSPLLRKVIQGSYLMSYKS